MIDILLATYNGEKYLSEQIESIINQTYKEWILYIRDDGSKDNTINIVKRYVEMHPKKIKFIEDNKSSLGAKMNFAELIRYSKNDYCMFCDQDDFWLPNKIEITFLKMKEVEEIYGKKEPILIHTDLKVVDENLNTINNSFWGYMNLNYKKSSLNYMITQNMITGCTMMINKSLVDVVEVIPSESYMHDWWIGLVASVFGKIDIVDEGTILYRQHNNNEIGAKKERPINMLINKMKSRTKVVIFESEIRQMKKFFDIYNEKLNNNYEKLIKEFISIRSKNAIERKSILIKNRIFHNDIIINIKNIIFI